MTGVVAMASVTADFDPQPCKKSCQDDGSRVVKTIANPLSPIAKPMKKLFSPPRSNNIMEYFSRKTPSSKKTSSPDQSKENYQWSDAAETDSHTNGGKQPTQKQGRKASKVTRKLVTGESGNSCEDMVEVLHTGRSAEASAITGILERNVHDEWTGKGKDRATCVNSVKLKSVLMNTNELPMIVFSRDEAKLVNTSTKNDWKRQQQEAKSSDPDGNEVDCTLGDASMEVNPDEISMLNSSTVTVSFEDFVRSQDIIEEYTKERQGNNETVIPTEDSEQFDNLKSEENVESGKSSIQVSPRTVTIQAEVHVMSSKPEANKTVTKIASIFNYRKGRGGPAELALSSHPEAGHQLPLSSLTVKRKSNVVLQEGDLEGVLEIESTSRCSESERKQFMAAFKRPSTDGYKSKPVNGQGKQKESGEQVLERFADDNVNSPSAEQVSQAYQENKIVKVQPARAGRNKPKEEKKEVTTAHAVVEEVVARIFEDDGKREEPQINLTSSIAGARRSIRKVVVRQSPETIPTSVRKNRKLNETNDTVATSLPQDSTVKMSTSKTLKAKHGIFVAEMLCSLDTEESPIRIKFTRVQKNVSISKAESGMNFSKESLREPKNKRVKKLVEKAKGIQQSKKISVLEKRALRHTSQTEASMKRNCCEDEDSVICVEEDQNASHQRAPGKGRTKRPLRNLNFVLGQAAQSGIDTKAVPDSKVALQGESGSVGVSIVDESSHKGSEKSHNEQFEARIKFLKSGLPESFKKQMDKTIVSKEAYFLSCSAFQPVTHTTQLPNENNLWPESLLLRRLKDLWSQTFNPPQPTVIGPLCVKTIPACRRISEKFSGWKLEISDYIRQLLIEESRASNPHFTAHQFITRFLKRRTDDQQQFTATGPEAAVRPPDTSTLLPAEPVGGKRKRREDEGDNTVKVAKKQRANRSIEIVSIAHLEPKRCSKDDVVRLTDLPLREDPEKRDVFKEDIMWTDKYQPQHSSDIVDNAASVRRLHSWLKQWKLRADQEERKRQKNKKTEECSIDWEEDSQDGGDMLCNTVLISGPTGVGKTAAVYACAQELGFKVFEVNASSQRNGRLILSQLKEATQSHQVDSQGIRVSKPTYFTNYGMNSSPGTARPRSSPGKLKSPRGMVSSPRKHPQLPKGVNGGSRTPTSLANFFKMGHAVKKEPPNMSKNENMVMKANTSGSKHEGLAARSTATTAQHSEEPSKKTATSLILFEEVDVIFDDDSGFLTAIKTFMTTTKRPVILTTNDPAFSSMFDGTFEEILFKTPSVLNVGSYLQLLCLAEDLRTDPSDVSSLLRLNGCDIRQSLLQLQFWTRSAGGSHTARPLVQTGKNEADIEVAGDTPATVLSTLPPCDTGCTESKLGLLNIEPERDIWELLVSQSLVQEPFCWEMLADCRQQGVDMLYSNMETLLPVPVTQLSTSCTLEQCVSAPQGHLTVDPIEQVQSSHPQSDMLSSYPRLLHIAELAEELPSNRMTKNKRQYSRHDEDGLHSDSEDEFLSLCSLQSTPRAKEEFKESLMLERVKKKPITNEERVKMLTVSQCLESIADFLDNMSYMDSSLLSHPGMDDINRRMLPVRAVIKDGMTDETRGETDRGSWLMLTGDCVLEIQAALEVLSFHKCRASVGESWEKAQQLEGELGKEAVAKLSLPVGAHHKEYSFTQDGPCQPQLVRRREMMESLMWRGVFGTIGYRPAAVDYLPIIRTICRSEQLKEQGKVKRRFLHYLDAVHMGLDKNALQLLAEDFG
ncbi:ATPase family AAA domain-containing protein 5 isoform X2 [Mugil cephalus]|uniref:ATPase family AAA domain-containing protein 5 isoform X2 n=1 Tax=Mugil cephalus TaxID=48193 RepID=UPI001FB62974|nr:ATPase family AAA domain-containing protein 5 isoform X2 [Mugil cephalus]